MSYVTAAHWRELAEYIVGKDLDFGEYCRRLIFAFGVSCALLITVVFGVYHVFVDAPVEGAVNLATGSYLLWVLWRLPGHPAGQQMARGVAIVTGLLVIYFGAMATDHSYRVVWPFVYAAVAPLMYGRNEGLLYVSIVYAAWLVALFVPGSITGLVYENGLAIRFAVSYPVVAILGWASESIHSHYRREMARRNRQLESDRKRLQRAEAQMRRLALRDPLTGIANRRSILGKLDKALVRRAGGGKLAVAVIDIDHFKVVNDTFGHDAGDAVLVQVTERIERIIRHDDVLGRYGGEEFLVIIPDISSNDLPVVLEKIRRCVASEPFRYENHEISITLSIGAALQVGQPEAGDLIRAADDAVYAAKDGGRNRYVVARELTAA